MEKLLQILTFVFFLTQHIFHGNSQRINATEQSILLALKQHWSQSNLAAWTTSSDHCTWPEVTCSDGSVTGLNLVNQNLNQPIPATVCDLRNLTHLDLSDNFLPGPFPTVLYNCSSLRFLNLSSNYLVGPIPADVHRLSPRLQFLNLEANNFTSDIPAAIGRLSELVTLKLNTNLFDGSIASEIGDLSNLEELVLSHNNFAPQPIPSTFGRLTKLRNFWATVANLVGEIPQEIGNMSALEQLDLSANRLNGSIPDGLFRLRNLTIVMLYNAGLSGPIPPRIEALELQILDLSSNTLTGTIPDDIGKLRKLTGLGLQFNLLSGAVPASIAKLPELVNLHLFSNKLSGELPLDLGLHSMLARVEFSENLLSGELPKNLCANQALIGLIAFDNNLTGSLPDSLGNCSSLRNVRVEKNRLSGKIPDGLWTSPNLETLMLSNNLFEGQLPERIGQSLSLIEIMNNRFSGPIPAGISSWQELTVIRASNNSISGEIPKALTALSSLTVALFNRNQLSGELPWEIISWKSLSTLDLSVNRLSGEIPASLGLLPDLVSLDLSGNQLSGQIPSEISNPRLSSLNLSSNRLSGRIPAYLENAAYSRSFLENPGLCSDDPAIGINRCNGKSGRSAGLSSKFIAAVSSIAAMAIIVAFCYTILVYRRYARRSDDNNSTWKLTSFQRLNFTEANILSSLTDDNLIGAGGSGRVYLVPIGHSGERVAVKRIWDNMTVDHKREKEFQAEVEILGTIRHSNIVKLYCCMSSEASKLLVYEHMENGSLDRWLHKKMGWNGGSRSLVHNVRLDWPKRVQIAIGAAQGLCYMHHSCMPPIIHRDVKSSNILLDSGFNAKIADFGLARMMIKSEANTMSVVAGSFGYMAPEYAETRRASEKIDVYSFGVVLLELVTGKEAQNGDESSSLVEWAWRCCVLEEGKPVAANTFDEDIKESVVYMEEIHNVFKLGLICTSRFPSRRPSMKAVLQVLLHCSKSIPQDTNANYCDIAPLLLNFSSDVRVG